MNKRAVAQKVADAYLSKLPMPTQDGFLEFTDHCRKSVKKFMKEEQHLERLKIRLQANTAAPFLQMKSWSDLLPREYAEVKRAVAQAANQAENGKYADALQSLSVAESLFSRKRRG